MSDSLSSMVDELLAELKNSIVVSEKESDVDRTEKETAFLFNRTQTKSMSFHSWTLFVSFISLYNLNLIQVNGFHIFTACSEPLQIFKLMK
jgi:hypothetical protein